ncbi:MAG: hypothetical protein K6G43_11025 [Lachnospiraceae bacterium]|nr:hypothetical protein [Lachnospiraceae bacterium]
MKKNESINEVEKLINHINEILLQRDEEIRAIESVISNDNEMIRNAEAEIEKAVHSNDVSTYRDAKSKQELARDNSDLHTLRLEQLKQKPLVTEDEYKEWRDKVLAEVDNMQIEALETAGVYLAKIEEIARIMSDYIYTANTTLSRWQLEVYKDPETRFGNGNLNVLGQTKVKYSAVTDLINYVCQTPEYQKIIATAKKE